MKTALSFAMGMIVMLILCLLLARRIYAWADKDAKFDPVQRIGGNVLVLEDRIKELTSNQKASYNRIGSIIDGLQAIRLKMDKISYQLEQRNPSCR